MLPAGIRKGRKICHFHPATKRFYCCEKFEKIFLFCDLFRSKESAFIAVERDARS